MIGAAEPRMFMENESLMAENSQDRRNVRRFDMHLPAVVQLDGMTADGLLTETQNVSARGIFFYLDRPLCAGARIEVTMTFPPHITLTESVRVRFGARVIRVEDPLPGSRIGMAAAIEQYEFLPTPQPHSSAGGAH
jgi:PilZ domain